MWYGEPVIGRLAANLAFFILIVLLAPLEPSALFTRHEGRLWLAAFALWGAGEGLGLKWAWACQAIPKHASTTGRWLDRLVALGVVAALTISLRHWTGAPLTVGAQFGYASLVGIGLWLRLWAMRTLKEHFHAGLLLERLANRSGPYRFINHPAYLGLILILLGLVGLLQSAWGFAVVAGGAFPLLALRGALERRKF